MRDMLNMRVTIDEHRTERTSETPVKQKVGHRLQAAILRNIHHERKLKLECEALQKAKKTVEHDIRQIEQKLQRTQRNPTGHDFHLKHSIKNQSNGKKVILERSPPSSKANQQLPKVKGSFALTGTTEGGSHLPAKLKEDADTVPAYGQRFLNMLGSSHVDYVAGRGAFARSFSKEQSDEYISEDGDTYGFIDGMTFSSGDEGFNVTVEAAADTLMVYHDNKLSQEVAGYSRHLVKMDHIAKRRSSGTDDMERVITDSIVNMKISSLRGSERKHEKSQAVKYEDHYDLTSKGKQKLRDNGLRRGSQPNCSTDSSAREPSVDVKDSDNRGEELGLSSYAKGERSSKSDGDLKRLALDGFSADSVEKYWQKISNPTISKKGEMYDQTGCFITTLKKKENDM